MTGRGIEALFPERFEALVLEGEIVYLDGGEEWTARQGAEFMRAFFDFLSPWRVGYNGGFGGRRKGESWPSSGAASATEWVEWRP